MTPRPAKQAGGNPWQERPLSEERIPHMDEDIAVIEYPPPPTWADLVGRTLYERVLAYFDDPEAAKRFEEWHEARKEAVA